MAVCWGLSGLSSLEVFIIHPTLGVQKTPKKRSRSPFTDSLPNYEITNPQRRHDPLLVPNIRSTTRYSQKHPIIYKFTNSPDVQSTQTGSALSQGPALGV